MLEFEYAAVLRDWIIELRGEMWGKGSALAAVPQKERRHGAAKTETAPAAGV